MRFTLQTTGEAIQLEAESIPLVGQKIRIEEETYVVESVLYTGKKDTGFNRGVTPVEIIVTAEAQSRRDRPL